SHVAQEPIADDATGIGDEAVKDVEEEIAKAEENLAQKIDENSTRLSTMEETLASLLKAQQE
ncbi:hypothetical protein Dimus_027099, partial [Dionaea muscipula]